jgi:hypothetical protein
MIQQIYDPGVYLISKDKAAQARQILSQVTLRPFKEPPLVIPTPPAAGARAKGGVKPADNFKSKLTVFATEYARRRGITDSATIDSIAKIVGADLTKGMAQENILKKLNRLFPVKKPVAPVAPATTAPATTSPRQRKDTNQSKPIRERRA